MIGKLIGAVIGERIAGRYGTGAKGALLGAAAPIVARSLFGPLGVALAGAYAIKKSMNGGRTGLRRRCPSRVYYFS